MQVDWSRLLKVETRHICFSFSRFGCCLRQWWRVSDDTGSLLRSSSCFSFPKVSFVVERSLSAFMYVEAWCLVSVYGLAGAQGRWWSRTIAAFSVVCGGCESSHPCDFVCILRSRVLCCRLWQRKFIPAVALLLLVLLMV